MVDDKMCKKTINKCIKPAEKQQQGTRSHFVDDKNDYQILNFTFNRWCSGQQNINVWRLHIPKGS